MSQRVARRWPRASSSCRSSGYSNSSPLKATQIEPSSLAIGCRPPARSMIDSRRAPRATPGSMWTCSSSGPRWAIAPVIASSRRRETPRARQIERAGDSAHDESSSCQMREPERPAGSGLVRPTNLEHGTAVECRRLCGTWRREATSSLARVVRAFRARGSVIGGIS